MSFDTLPDDAWVRSPMVRTLFGDISEDTLSRRIAAGLIPAPQKLPGGRVNFWTAGSIRAALRASVEAA